MNEREQIIEAKLLSNLILSWCNEKSEEGKIEFEHSFATASKFRFCTPLISSIFKDYFLRLNYSYFFNLIFILIVMITSIGIREP